MKMHDCGHADDGTNWAEAGSSLVVCTKCRQEFDGLVNHFLDAAVSRLAKTGQKFGKGAIEAKFELRDVMARMFFNKTS
jgi:hypothetical protein